MWKGDFYIRSRVTCADFSLLVERKTRFFFFVSFADACAAMSEFSRSENLNILQRNREQDIHVSIDFLSDFLSAYWNPSYTQYQQSNRFAQQFTGLGAHSTNKQDRIKRILRHNGAEPWENASLLAKPPMPKEFKRNRQRNERELRENRAGIETECTECEQTMGEWWSLLQNNWYQRGSSGIDQETGKNREKIER